MKVLGISDNHDSGAALLVDGALVAAINQERIDRVKGSSAFPWGAIDAVLDRGQVRARDIDRIVVGTSFTPSAFLRLFPNLHQKSKKSGQFSPLLHGYMLYQSVLRRSGLHSWEIDGCKAILEQRLKKRPFENADLHLMDHHTAHAQGAYRTQEHAECLVLTLDAMGDGCSATAWLGHNGILRPLWEQSGLAAINLFYSQVTEFLGFRPLRHEGKITGLAAYVPPDPHLLGLFRTRIHFSNGRFNRMNIWKPSKTDDEFWFQVRSYSKETIAACAQSALEEATLAFIEHWIRHTECGNLALAGGVFANVRLNQKIAEIPGVRSIWIMPHMGDGGLAVGAALGSLETEPKALEHCYWGNEHNRTDRLRAIQRHNVQKTDQNILEKAAALLSQGCILGRSCGPMEWGPRALGNRSIIALPSDHGINDRLNAKLKRSEFMPFAPLVRYEDAEKYFINPSQAGRSAEFMTICMNTTPLFQQKCPAAVHVDKTARPQLLRRSVNPSLYDLLTEVEKKTGTGVLINTSLNMHEEPITATPDESIRACKEAGLDGLLMDNYLLQW